jgi:hypothetical protein
MVIYIVKGKTTIQHGLPGHVGYRNPENVKQLVVEWYKEKATFFLLGCLRKKFPFFWLEEALKITVGAVSAKPLILSKLN